MPTGQMHAFIGLVRPLARFAKIALLEVSQALRLAPVVQFAGRDFTPIQKQHRVLRVQMGVFQAQAAQAALSVRLDIMLRIHPPAPNVLMEPILQAEMLPVVHAQVCKLAHSLV